MKKLYNTLAIIALATVAMFTAQTAKAQTVLDNNDDPELKEKVTFTKVYPNGSSTSVTFDFEALYNQVLVNPKYTATIREIREQGDKATPLDVYNAFMKAGLDEETSWIVSELYKMYPNIITLAYPNPWDIK